MNITEAINDGITLYTLEDIMHTHNITTDIDGNAMHCGHCMQVGYGLCGSDSARCTICGLEIVNMHSPHINGGHMFDDVDTNRVSWISNHDIEGD